MTRTPWRTYRSLILVYAVAIAVGVVEYRRRLSEHEHEIYRDSPLSYVLEMRKLYEGRAEVEYLLARRSEMRYLDQHGGQNQLTYDQMRESFGEAIEHYERARQAGLRGDENVIYNYALNLMWVDAAPEKIDRAIAEWQRNFPRSKRQSLDLRRREIRQVLDRWKAGSIEAQRQQAVEQFRDRRSNAGPR